MTDLLRRVSSGERTPNLVEYVEYALMLALVLTVTFFTVALVNRNSHIVISEIGKTLS
jgi:hypothetical protein